MPARHRSAASDTLRRRVAVAALLVAALGTGAVAGRLSDSATPTDEAGGWAGGGPGFAATPHGAAAAAAWYMRQIYDSRGLSEDRVRSRFASLVTRGEALERLVDLATTDVTGRPVIAGSITRAATVGVKQEAYQAPAARIGVWSVLLYSPPPNQTGSPPATPPSTSSPAGSPATGPSGSATPTGPGASSSATPSVVGDGASDGSAEGGGLAGPQQRWVLDVVSLEWREGGWRFAATTTVQGPMPPPDPMQAPNAVGVSVYLLDAAGGAYQAVPDDR
jgi:hypothetical protein